MATNPDDGISTWFTGLARLVDLVIVLHKRDELELETVSAASQACAECWTVAGNWRGFDDCRQRVREVGGRLKIILDPNERTYRGKTSNIFSLSVPMSSDDRFNEWPGQRVYAP